MPRSRRKPPGARMSIAQHLGELRRRLVRAVAAIAAASVAGWFATDLVLAGMRQPVIEIAVAQHRNAALNFSDITGAFDLKLQIAITLGVVVASPVWLYQLFAFLLPAMKRREKQLTLGFTLSAVPLFLVGCSAGWFVLPHIVQLMTGFAASDDASLIDAKPFYDFILKLVLAVGIAFTIPVFLVVLNLAGVVSAKAIIRSWRVAIIAIVLFTAIATPSADVFSMFLLAVPMLLLYFSAAGIAAIHDRRLSRRPDRSVSSAPPNLAIGDAVIHDVKVR